MNNNDIVSTSANVLLLLEEGEVFTLDHLGPRYRLVFPEAPQPNTAELKVAIEKLVSKGDAVFGIQGLRATSPFVTQRVTTRLLEVMPPGQVLKTAEIARLYFMEYGSHLSDDAINSTLSHLHHKGKEGDRAVVGEDYTSWTRPIEPGIGATFCIGSDRYACTVISVSSGLKKIVTRDDISVRLDKNGMSEDQSYEYKPGPDGTERTFHRDRKGNYADKRRGGFLILGVRRAYHDFSF